MNGGDINLSLQQCCNRGSPWEWLMGRWLADGGDCHLEKGVSGPSDENHVRKPWDAGAFGVGCLWATRVMGHPAGIFASPYLKHPRAPVELLKSLPVRGAEALLDPCASGHIHNQSVLSSQGGWHWGSCRMSGSICVILISPNLAGAYFPSNDLMLWGDSF